MTRTRGFGLPEQHLLPDVIVAFVDGELGPVPCKRAAAHLHHCATCAADVAAQRQARGAVRSAEAPHAPAGLLSSLRSIPTEVDLPSGPDGLALTSEGQLVAVQRPDKAAALGGPVLGSSEPLGRSGRVLGGRGRAHKRAAQGAGVVASGLMLGALVVVNSQVPGQLSQAPGSSTRARPPAVAPVGGAVRAEFGGRSPNAKRGTSEPRHAPTNAPTPTGHGSERPDATPGHGP